MEQTGAGLTHLRVEMGDGAAGEKGQGGFVALSLQPLGQTGKEVAPRQRRDEPALQVAWGKAQMQPACGGHVFEQQGFQQSGPAHHTAQQARMAGEGSHSPPQAAWPFLLADSPPQRTDNGIGGHLVGAAVHTGAAEQALGERLHAGLIEFGPAREYLRRQNQLAPGHRLLPAAGQIGRALCLTGAAAHTRAQIRGIVAKRLVQAHAPSATVGR